MTHPSKRHNGRRVTLLAGPNCLDAGKTLTGIYRHRGRFDFGFEIEGRDPKRPALFSRDEWSVVTLYPRVGPSGA